MDLGLKVGDVMPVVAFVTGDQRLVASEEVSPHLELARGWRRGAG